MYLFSRYWGELSSTGLHFLHFFHSLISIEHHPITFIFVTSTITWTSHLIFHFHLFIYILVLVHTSVYDIHIYPRTNRRRINPWNSREEKEQRLLKRNQLQVKPLPGRVNGNKHCNDLLKQQSTQYLFIFSITILNNTLRNILEKTLLPELLHPYTIYF